MAPLRVVIVLALALAASPARGASYYPIQPPDPSAVLVDRSAAGARGDGVADDTAAIQRAIDAVQETTGEGIVLVPPGRYRLTRTVYVWPGIRVLGFGSARPAFVLATSTPGYQDASSPRYLVFFAGRRPADGSTPPDANPGTFYSALSNVDIEIGDGNAGAVGVRARYAQHCFTSHVEFRIGSGLAGILEGGNVAEDVRFVGGEYGIWTGTPSPGWQYTLVDARFEGQRKAAIREHAAGLTLIRPQFRHVPTAVEIEAGSPDDLWMSDARFEDVTGAALVVSLERSPRTQINLERAVCLRVPVFAAFSESGRTLRGAGEAYSVPVFSHGLHYDDLGAAGEITTVYAPVAVPSLPPPAPSDLAPLPPMEQWVSARAFGARGDGVADDTEALRRAIAASQAVYLPSGKYVVSDTLLLGADTALIGLHPSTTQLVVPDRTPAFQGSGPPKPLVEAPAGGATIVTGIGLYTNGINPRAVAAKWMSGARSLMNDVRFLGGHGTTGRDGRRENPYNNTHTADPDLERRWDSQYPSLWVTGGGGTFFDIWTPSTFAQSGMLVSDTSTPGRVYQMSSEHHVRYEVQLHRVANWELHALQTEEERGESGFALPVEIRDCHDVLLTNLHAYRVISSDQPFPWTVTLSSSHGIRFRGVHVYSNSKVAFDSSIYDADHAVELRQRELAWLDVSGHPAERRSTMPPVVAPGASVERLAAGFHNISGAAAGPDGDVYFVDAKWQRIYRWGASGRVLSVVDDAPLQPVNLAFDSRGHLLVASYAGRGMVYVLDPASPAANPEWLTPRPAESQPGATFVLPVGDWRLFTAGVPQGLPPRTHQYVAPDGATVLSATQGFVDGQVSWGVKSADLVRAFGLQLARPGERVYLTSEADVTTWSARVTTAGGLEDLRPFVEHGGEGLAVDRDGNVYLAAGDVVVYDREGRLSGTIPIPERPTSLVLGGPGRRTLYVTARHGLYAIALKD